MSRFQIDGSTASMCTTTSRARIVRAPAIGRAARPALAGRPMDGVHVG
jgi:hypothetical protein